MAEAVIEIEGLTKIFKSGFLSDPVVAVRELSLTVQRGSVVAFVGPNGAGKTTTISLILGLLRPTQGSVLLFGKSPLLPESRVQLGYQSEIFRTYGFRRAEELLFFYGELSNMSETDLRREVPRQLERVGLLESRARKVKNFSKGMVQRLGLAQALLHQPELLVLDEPTTGLDPEGRILVADIIRGERHANRTVFLSSHILSDVETLCDEVIMIDRGQAVFTKNLAPVGPETDGWIIEVQSAPPELKTALTGEGYTVYDPSPGVTAIRCASNQKQAVLATVSGLGVEIIGVRRAKESLEQAYLDALSKRDR